MIRIQKAILILVLLCTPLHTMEDVPFQKNQQGRIHWQHLHPKDLERGSLMCNIKTVCKGLGRILRRNEPALPADWIAESEVVPTFNETHITWIGHATFLIQSADLNFVLDPFWGDYTCGPFILFPRLTPAVPALEKMPLIDYIMLSHRHADHCDEHAIRFFVVQNPACKALVPRGNNAFFRTLGFRDENIIECKWGDEITLRKNQNEIRCTFLPAAHGADDNSLWGCWHIHTHDNVSILHAGDTGDDPHFEQLPKAHAILLPIAPYTFRELQQPAHINPQEAVAAFKKLSYENSFFIPMHWATLPYCDDDPEENLQELKLAFEQAGLSENKLKILKFGQRVRLLDFISTND